MNVREQIAEVLHDFYIEASTRKISREEFEQFIDRIIALSSDTTPSEDVGGAAHE